MTNLIDVIGKVLIKSKENLKGMDIEEAWKDFTYDVETELAKIIFNQPIEKAIQLKRKTTKGKTAKKEN